MRVSSKAITALCVAGFFGLSAQATEATNYSAAAAVHEMDFHGCILGVTAKYSNAKLPNDEIPDLVLAGCIESLSLFRASMLKMNEALEVQQNQPAPKDGNGISMAAQAQADEATRVLAVQGRKEALDFVIKVRLNNSKPTGKKRYQ